MKKIVIDRLNGRHYYLKTKKKLSRISTNSIGCQKQKHTYTLVKKTLVKVAKQNKTKLFENNKTRKMCNLI